MGDDTGPLERGWRSHEPELKPDDRRHHNPKWGAPPGPERWGGAHGHAGHAGGEAAGEANAGALGEGAAGGSTPCRADRFMSGPVERTLRLCI